MDNLATKLINDHRNPIVKVEISGSKLFFKSSTLEETKYIEKHQAGFENILRHERAERRCNRSQAEWSLEDKLARVTKSIKTLSNFGYRDKNGTYLYPEETLFLMETNRLEVTCNEVPLSIQEGYDLLFKFHDLLKYRVYKKLALQGFRLLRHSELHRRLSNAAIKHEINCVPNEVQNKGDKRNRSVIGENCGCNAKKVKLMLESGTDNSILDSSGPSSSSSTSTNSKQSELLEINGIFERLRETAPREYVRDVAEDAVPDYYVFLPTNKSRCDYDFNLYICKDTSFLKRDTYSTPSLFAICSDGNISFYRFSSVKLPFL